MLRAAVISGLASAVAVCAIFLATDRFEHEPERCDAAAPATTTAPGFSSTTPATL